MGNRVKVTVEAAEKRVFVSAIDWPGWSRSGKTEEQAVEAFLAAAPRYAVVAAEAGLSFDADGIEVDPVERTPGDASTEYGVPRAIGDEDRRPVDASEAVRLAAIVAAAWTLFDRVAAAAPEELRKGPRGGGRDRSKIVAHVNDADGAYANQMGLKVGPGDVPAMRAAMLSVLRTPSDGSPIAGRKWTQRYAARRIAWHALDHAWEIEDRTEPA
jgi:hypothetical protein